MCGLGTVATRIYRGCISRATERGAAEGDRETMTVMRSGAAPTEIDAEMGT